MKFGKGFKKFAISGAIFLTVTLVGTGMFYWCGYDEQLRAVNTKSDTRSLSWDTLAFGTLGVCYFLWFLLSKIRRNRAN